MEPMKEFYPVELKSKPNDGGSAFPYKLIDPQQPGAEYYSSGMSLRAYLAAKAMQGILSKNSGLEEMDIVVAMESIKYADALIAALES